MRRKLFSRILSGILSAAMVFTMTPTVSFAAQPDEEAVVSVVEDGAEAEEEAGEEAPAEEINMTGAAASEEADGAVLEEEETADEFDYLNEVTINLGNVNTDVIAKDANLYTTFGPSGTINGANVTTKADADNGFSFVISPKMGYKLKNNGNIFGELSYDVVTVTDGVQSTRKAMNIRSPR